MFINQDISPVIYIYKCSFFFRQGGQWGLQEFSFRIISLHHLLLSINLIFSRWQTQNLQSIFICHFGCLLLSWGECGRSLQRNGGAEGAFEQILYTQMFQKQQIVAIEKTFDKPDSQSSWNNAVVRWFFVHQTPQNAKSYEVSLEIVYLSSRRDVKVNGVLKHTAMITFGYQSQFEICAGLLGRIKQEGINFNFEFFINGVAFTDLERCKPKYEAPTSLTITYEPEKAKEKQVNKQKKQNSAKSGPGGRGGQWGSGQASGAIQNKLSSEKEEQKIKDTQRELIKILKAQKLEKKA